jgi:Ca2+-binding RTX toxin-like protein
LPAVGGWLNNWKQRLTRPQVAKAPVCPPFRRKYLIEALEPRVLLSADLPVVPPPPVDPLPPEAPAISAGYAAGGEVSPDFAFDGAALSSELIAPGALSSEEPQIREIAFVDSRIIGREALSVQRDGMLVVVLDAQVDGLAQISAVLAGHEGVQAVHIIAHGASGQLQLGSSVLDSAAIDQGSVAAWGKALTEDGDLLLYGCDVAAGESGAAFMEKLAAATGADVAASTDATGPGWLGGDWDLEAATAQIEAPVVVLDDLSFLLAAINGTAGADVLDDNANSNDTLTGLADNDTYRFTDNFSGVVSGNDVVTDSGGTADEINFSGHPGGAVTFNLNFEFGSTFAAAVNVTDSAATTNKVVATGIESFVGGDGIDTLDFSNVTGDLMFELAAGGMVTIRLGGASITASNFERIIGGSGNNTFKILASGAFGGRIEGSGIAGVNTLDYSGYDSDASISLDSGRATGFEAADGAVTGITHVTGSAQADIITAGGDGVSYSGGDGSDVYRFVDNWGDAVVNDTLGSNTLSFATSDTGIAVEFIDDADLDTEADSIQVSDGFNSTLTATGSFVSVEGSTSDDTFHAGHWTTIDGEAVLAGVTVNADIFGGEGEDVFKVGIGSDFAGEVDGGGDDDTIDYLEVGGNVVRAGGDPNFSGGLVTDSVEFVQHPLTVPEGFRTVADYLIDVIDSTIGAIDIPMLGNIGAGASGYIEDFADFVVGGLTDRLLVGYADEIDVSPTSTPDLVVPSTAQLIENWLIDVLSVDFTSEIPYATRGTFGLQPGDITQYMEFALILEGSFLPPDTEVDIDFGAALPGLGLEVDAVIGVELTYTLRLAFGIDYSTPTKPFFYFDTNGADNSDASDDDELVIELEAYLEHQSLEDNSTIQATLGFLQFDIWTYDNSDQISLSNDGDPSIYQDDNRSGIQGRFALDLKDPGAEIENIDWAEDDGRLSHKEMKDAEFDYREAISAKFNAAADVDLFGRLSADVLGGGLPAIQLYLHYDQEFINAEIQYGGNNQNSFGGAPEIVIEDLAIDLGTFLSDFIRPIVQEIQVYTEPFIEPIKVLKQDIAFLSGIDFLRNLLDRDKDGEVSILDAMGTILGETKYGPVFAAVEALINVIELINSVPDEGNLLIPFGTFTFGGDARGGQVTAPTSGVPDEAAMKNKIKNSAAKPETKSFLEKLKRDPINGGFSAPILTEPMQILKLLTGDGSANLFFYDFPQIDFDFNFRKSFSLFFPFNMVIDAGFHVQVRMGFGLDATGLIEFIDDLKPGGDDADFLEIFSKGFFIDDHFVNGVDLPEFLVEAHFLLGASVGISGIVEAGIQGGVIGTLAIDLNDVDSNGAAAGGIDYKVRFSELLAMIRTGPLCFLNFDGQLEWLLEAFVWVGLDLGFFGTITLYSETFDLGGGVIFEFSYHCGVTATPDVAHIEGGNLVLHMGEDAGRRNDADVNWTDIDGSADEDFQVIFVAAGTDIADYALDGEPTVAAQDSYIVLYNGTGEIFAKSAVTGNIVVNGAGDGKDVLNVGENVAAGVVFHGGAGNDKVTYSGTGKARVWGDDGDDRISVNAVSTAVAGPTVVGNATTYDSEIYGGAGNDTLSGRRGAGAEAVNDGDDYIDGGDGNDKITGFGGNDELRGGDESVAITNNKANGDTIDGGDGNDTIYGGTGSDIIKGGAGNDAIHGGDESGALANGKQLGDTIDGGAGNDTINGNGGADVIKGAAGDDTIRGGAGDDAITGGAGLDSLYGDAGNDTFNWAAGGDGVDAVIDGGTDSDRIIVTGQNINTNIELKAGGGDVNLVWGSQTLDLDFVEKYALNAGTGDDSFIIRDLSGTSVNDVAMGLGSSIVDETRYDWDGDGTVEEVEGAGPRYLTDGDGNQILVGGQPVIDDYDNVNNRFVLSKVVRVTTFDTFADSVVIESAAGDDRFTGGTQIDPVSGSTIVNLSRTGTQTIAYSIAQSDQAQDTFRLDSGAGNDSIDMSAITTKAFAAVDLVAGDGNDTVFGTQFADTIDSGSGDDKVSGNAGLDTFSDAGGVDTLSEVNHGSPNNVFNAVTGQFTATSTSTSNFNLNTANFALNGNTLTIAHVVTEAEDISVFEEASLVSGTGANTFTVQNWMKSARLDGGAGSDTYNITFAGSGSGSVTEFDSVHVPGDVDRMFLYGTAGADRLNFTARNEIDAAHPTINPDLLLTDGSVAALHDYDTTELTDDTVETVNYTQSEALVVRGGDGDDIFVVDDNALTLNVYGEAGNDFFVIGRVTESQEVPPGSGVLVATAVTNGVSSESFFYGDFGEDSGGEINVAQSGNDNFEVNHNKAPVWLFGNAGDDRFVVNAVLIPGVDNDSNVSGGSGINSIEYLQNAPVNIDGGSGTDTVVINGTGIGDTFIVAVVLEDDNPDPLITNLVEKQKVIGAGVQVNMKNVEKLEVNGAGGNDRIHVFSTLPGLEVLVTGGSGDDTIHIGGDAVAVVIDPPEYTIDPPAYVYDAAPYIESWQSVTWSWGGYWYFDWSSFPFVFFLPVISYTWWFPVWVDPAPVTIDPPPQQVNPPAFQFTHAATTVLTGVKGKLTIEGGDLDGVTPVPGFDDADRIVVHNQSGAVADTGTLTTGNNDGDATTPDIGLISGLGTGLGIYYKGAEFLDIHLNDGGNDQFVIETTDADATTTIYAGGGNDSIRVKAANGVLQLDGGDGDDTFQVWSDAEMVDGVLGTLRINGGAGTDDVEVRDTANTADSTAALSATTLTGLSMTGAIEYGPFTTQTTTVLYQFQSLVAGTPPTISTVNNPQIFTLAYSPIETLLIGTGSGNDLINVTGTQAVTTINTNDGDDTVNVSSDGALLSGHLDDVDGELTLDLGAGGNTLSVSDLASVAGDTATISDSAIAGMAPAVINYTATSGRFTGGVNVQFGKGNDDIILTSTAAGDVTTIDANEGDDSVTVDAGQLADLIVLRGGLGQDTLDASASSQPIVLFGDDGEETYGTAIKSFANLTSVSSLNAGAGDMDSLFGGSATRVIAVGGAGDDVITGGSADDVLIGDDGSATFASEILTAFGSLGTAGGDDQIDGGEGRNYLIGGIGGDTLTAGGGNDVALGDNGSVTYTAAGEITTAISADLGSGGADTITLGEGNNVAIGGAAGDTIGLLGTGAGDDVLVGDNGTVTWDPATGNVVQFESQGTDGGNDTIVAGDGRNLVLGGAGADGVTSGTGEDLVLGDNGRALFTSAGIITLFETSDAASGGGDTVAAGEGRNIVSGGFGGDSIGTLGGDDLIIGDNGRFSFTAGVLTEAVTTDTDGSTGGNDNVTAGDGHNVVLGGVGADGVTSGTGNDLVLGDNGRALLTSAGVITLFETSDPAIGGGDTIAAGEGRNIVSGGFGGDTVSTLGGDDLIIGDNGRFSFTAGVLTEAVTTDTDASTGGNDTLTAGDGHNVVLGGVGNDAITTGGGDDVVLGDNGTARFEPSGQRLSFETGDAALAGDDTIDAGAGDDIVLGGTGADTIQGGAGNDILLGDQGTAQYAGGELALVFGEPLIGGSDFLDGGTGNDILLGGGAADSMAANLSDDVFTGDSARITFAGGLVTSIELFGEPDLVLQTLFKLYSNGDNGLEGGDVVIVEEDGDDERGADRFLILESDDGRPGRGAGQELPAHALVLSFLRGQHLAQLPQELRNMILELSLGRGTPGAGHGGEDQGQGQGQGGGKPPAEPQSEAAPFSIEAEATTLIVPAAEAKDAGARGDDDLTLAAAALSGAALATSGRTVRTFDPASGRFSERGAPAAQESTNVDRLRFVGTGIDW